MSDKVILDLIKQEYERQKNTIELIASENYPSVESSNAMASILTCKYSEGYPGKRYYGGCEVIDKIGCVNCSVQTMQMCSFTAVRRRIWRLMQLCSI